ncbi:PDT-domain-containing protein [Panus rudis PR-1116 ss-1]|nr:PDT-domain-containing protein [Panus rudis PR-1116 ss-1]
MASATEETNSPQALPRLSFLGPIGTYSHQCAQESFGTNVDYVQKSTIAEVFHSVGPDITYGVIPQENSIFGPVVETYDCLRLQTAGYDKFVRGEITVAVQHCLVARAGTKEEDIKTIVSHEQALGQCSRFLAERFPNVILEKSSSTAEAAQLLLEEVEETGGTRAAICSSVCASTFEGLEVLHRGIQDEKSNFTRFYVISNSIKEKPPLREQPPRLRRALVRVGLPSPKDIDPESFESLAYNRPLNLLMSTLLTTFGVPVLRIDRRPSLNPIPFEDVYFIELEELGTPPEFREKDPESSMTEREWLKKVLSGVDRVKAVDLDAALLGIW